MSAQLDFAFFFHGLAFLLLGTVSLNLARSTKNGSWHFLALFGFVHGAEEWLDLIACTIADFPAFGLLRTALTVFAFLLLLEFTRQEAIDLGIRPPGRWVCVPSVVVVIIGGFAEGLGTAEALTRYLLAFPCTAAASLIFAWQAMKAEGERKLLAFTAIGFCLYAFAAGIIVPSAPFWLANVLNEEAFAAVTGTFIELVRGVLAFSIAVAVCVIWSQKLARDAASARYTGVIERQIVWTLLASTIVLASGSALTDYLGELYQREVEADASAELDLIAGRLNVETASLESIMQVITSMAPLQQLSAGGSRDDAERLLDQAVKATGAKSGYLIASSGAILAASGNSLQRPIASGTPEIAPIDLEHLLEAAGRGEPAQQFLFDPQSRETDYLASYPMRDAAGKISGLAVLQRSLADFEASLRRFHSSIFLVDPEGVVVITNRPQKLLQRMWPRRASTVRTTHAEQGASVRDGAILSEEITGGTWQRIEGEYSYAERRAVNASGWSLVVAKPVQNIFAGRILGITITLLMTLATLMYALGRGRSVHDRIQMMKRLELQELATELKFRAITDPLTGLNNRRWFDEVLSLDMLRAQRYATPLSLVLYDIDHFKSINDTHGHLVGDKVLMQLSELIASRIRGTDELFRWGGEEFAILLPGAAAQMAVDLAKSLRDLISDAAFEGVGKVTCSFGVAQYDGTETAEEFVARADAALYRAKMNGRNRIELDPRRPLSRIQQRGAAA